MSSAILPGLQSALNRAKSASHFNLSLIEAKTCVDTKAAGNHNALLESFSAVASRRLTGPSEKSLRYAFRYVAYIRVEISIAD